MAESGSLESTFRKVADFCQRYREEGPLPSNSPTPVEGKELLSSFGGQLEEALEIPEGYRVTWSTGAGSFPYVPWVAILAPGQDVSKGVYVAVCFDSKGRGAVAGLVRSVTANPDIDLSVVNRTPLPPGAPDVDSPSGHASQAFNDAFHNPAEFVVDDFSATPLVEHLQESLDLYQRLLQSADQPPNYFVLRIGAGSDPDNPEVKALLEGEPNPFEVSGLYTYADDIGAGDVVFIVLGGGKRPVDWDRGLAAIGLVRGEIYDVGYKETKNGIPYYRVKIGVIARAPKPVSLEALNFDKEYGKTLHDAPIVGANRVSQAIAGFTPEQARAAVGALLKSAPDLYEELRTELPPEIIPGERPTSERAELEPDELEILNLMLEYGQIILYGPPGTGKTYKALRVASTRESFRVTVFHPSYGYEDFIGGLRPRLQEESEEDRGEPTTFTIEEHVGIFQDICTRAADGDGQHVLVIDEINRGDIARIFGELIYVLEVDKRGFEVALPYVQGRTLTVPPNVFIIGTMNSSDRSIALIDVALRRRFAFHEVPPEPSLLEGHSIAGVDLAAVMRGLNRRLLPLLDRDHLIGHAYFFDPRTERPFDDLNRFRRAWNGRIMPLIEEYFYSNPARMHDVLGSSFVMEEEIPISGSDGDYGTVYSPIVHDAPESFADALRGIISEESDLPPDGTDTDEPGIERSISEAEAEKRPGSGSDVLP